MSLLTAEAELREQLMLENEEFRKLATEHQAYDRQLSQLSSRTHLTEAEQLEEITLKKKKLLLKDQMYSILQRYKKGMVANS